MVIFGFLIESCFSLKLGNCGNGKGRRRHKECLQILEIIVIAIICIADECSDCIEDTNKDYEIGQKNIEPVVKVTGPFMKPPVAHGLFNPFTKLIFAFHIM